MKQILVGLDKECKMLFALVDDEDYDRVARAGSWNISKGRTGRIDQVRMCVGSGKRKVTTSMHHFIFGKPPQGMVVDHINRNPLDNRKENLRFTTAFVNARNAETFNNNIFTRGNRFYVRVCFKTQEHAKQAVKLLLSLRQELYGDIIE